jgi:hypothetical protein
VRRDVVSKVVCIALVIACLTAACALNMASSKLSYGDRVAVQGFPKRVVVATIQGNPPTGYDVTTRLAQGLVDLGFDVVMTGIDVDRILRQRGSGVSETVTEEARKKLQEAYKVEGLLVGTMAPDKELLLLETRLSLRLVAIPSGNLAWSANVTSQEIPRLSAGMKAIGVALAEKALEALEKDLYPQPKKTAGTAATSTTSRNQQEGSN